MNVQDLISQTQEALTVRRVFGEPIERDGATVIPAAKIRGAAGGGEGEDGGPQKQGRGSGGGYGFYGKPAGVYVIRGDRVEWKPAVDVNQIIAGGQLVGLLALLVLRSWLRRRAD